MNKINEYIYENEIWKDDDIVCPYCKYHLEDDDAEVLYREYDNEEFECPECGRKFFLTSGYDWWYTTTPMVEEIEKILEEDDE